MQTCILILKETCNDRLPSIGREISGALSFVQSPWWEGQRQGHGEPLKTNQWKSDHFDHFPYHQPIHIMFTYIYFILVWLVIDPMLSPLLHDVVVNDKIIMYISPCHSFVHRSSFFFIVFLFVQLPRTRLKFIPWIERKWGLYISE